MSVDTLLECTCRECIAGQTSRRRVVMQDRSLPLEGAVGEFVMQEDPIHMQGTVMQGTFVRHTGI